MKSKFFLFAIMLILVVSLVPLGGVSAQRTSSAPASSASLSAAPAPAARAVYYKAIKTQLIVYCNSQLCFKYVQKIYWGYNYKTIRYCSSTVKGVTFLPGWYFLAYADQATATAGGVGYTYYRRWTEGLFYNSAWGNYYIDIKQKVYYDGTWWKEKWLYGPL